MTHQTQTAGPSAPTIEAFTLAPATVRLPGGGEATAHPTTVAQARALAALFPRPVYPGERATPEENEAYHRAYDDYSARHDLARAAFAIRFGREQAGVDGINAAGATERAEAAKRLEAWRDGPLAELAAFATDEWVAATVRAIDQRAAGFLAGAGKGNSSGRTAAAAPQGPKP